MALIKCPECGHENVSDMAESCPQCGYTIRKHFENIKRTEKREQEQIEKAKQQEQLRKKTNSIGFKIGVGVVIAFLLIVLIVLIRNSQKQQYEKEYKINLAAQACSLYNYTDAVIDTIENMSSLEWYLQNTNKSQEEALTTYGSVLVGVLDDDHGLWSRLEPAEYTGSDIYVKEAYDTYVKMYQEYTAFCEIIANPYVPASDFIDEVYGKANDIIDLYAEIDANFQGNIETDYAIEDIYYGIYYRNKSK